LGWERTWLGRHCDRLPVSVKGMDIKILILAGLFLIGVALFLVAPKPVPTAPGITIEGAKAQWAGGLVGSRQLVADAAGVSPRVFVVHATAIRVRPLSFSPDLVRDANKVIARILVEHAATASPTRLDGSVTFVTAVSGTTPRILVEHVATAACLSLVEASETLLQTTQSASTKIIIEDAETIDFQNLESIPSE